MNYTLENNIFKIAITAIGAEISSFKSKKTGAEYIWQANPEIWGSHAPVLFPIVGGLKNDTYIHLGKKYQLPRHGFIRRNKSLKIIEKSSSSILLELLSSSQTLEIYPFSFSFQIQFTLIKNKLIVKHRIMNTGENDLFFSLGAHPAFNCPFDKNEQYDDYFLQFETNESLNTWDLNNEGLISYEAQKMINNTDILHLHSTIFNKDALIFKSLKSREVKLKSRNHHKEVIIRFNDFSSLGLWAKPNADFVCIEPWLGYADNENTSQIFSEKEGIIKLAAHREYTATYSIEIND